MSDKLSKAELHAQKACELEAFKSIKLDALKDKVTQMVSIQPLFWRFEQ